jgi:inner membrane protein
VPSSKDEKPVSSIWHIMPESLVLNGTMEPEIRYRGIYQSVVYGSNLTLEGEFLLPDKKETSTFEYFPEKAYFTVGISDNRGLKGDLILEIDSLSLQAEPGVMDNELFFSGVSFPINLEGSEQKIHFRMSLNLSGSESLLFIPCGKSTLVKLSSEWDSPSFVGSFLPSERTINESGFNAEWQVTHLNRNFPQNWIGTANKFSDSSFGVDLFLPVDHYQKSWRSARYGILFIALTFIVLIFLEITRKENIHIFHYFLVSLGLVLFFSLLNSLSEHLGFSLAYIIASSATIILITFFTSAVFRIRATSLIVAAMLAGLYVFIYVLLTLNDYAYLAGNIGLFVLLAIIMFLAGKMKIFKRNDEAISNGD